jgi:molybdenum cofactor cytidylyltransferase
MHSSQISILIVAAGSSSRMQSPKQLLDINGQPLIRKICKEALKVERASKVLVVLGANAHLIQPSIEDLNLSIFVHAGWQEGIGSSISAGVCQLINEHTYQAIIVLLCDQPAVSELVINELLDCFYETLKPLVASEYAHTMGVPALFHQRYFPLLLELTGNEGAKKIMFRQDKDHIALIDFPEGSIDLDTREDYEKYISSK